MGKTLPLHGEAPIRTATSRFTENRSEPLGGPEQVLGTVGTWWQLCLRWSGSNLAWTPDSKWLVVPESQAGERGLFLLSVETGRKRRLTAAPPPISMDLDPAFSREGHGLVFTRGNVGIRDLFLLELTDDFQVRGEPQRLTFEGKDVHSPVWTPTESGVYFLGVSPTKNSNLGFFDFATQKVHLLLETDMPCPPIPLGIDISPDRRTIAFNKWDRFDSDLMLVENFR